MPRVIRAFREAFPLVSLTLEECLSPDLLKRLGNEQMDAAFLRTPMAEPKDLVVDALLEEPMVMALPSAHALAQNDGDDAVSLKDLAGETFIVYARQHGPGLYGLVEGTARLDLDGNPAGEVTARDAEYAAARLAKILASREAAAVAAKGGVVRLPAPSPTPTAKVVTLKRKPVLRLGAFPRPH